MSLEVAFSTYPKEYLFESIVSLHLKTYKVDRILNKITRNFTTGKSKISEGN